ncbi:MAG TPA: beta/gamma crystallin-related protein [Acidobacteriota bacterium]|nr:beta/gamma crystallin-related protein [Acidobacteriota bacterium]
MTRIHFPRLTLFALILFALIIPAQAQYGYDRDCSRYPVLFEDDGFRGDSFPVERSVANLHDLDFGDAASSLCVPGGWRVIIFEDDRFGGDRLEIIGPERISDLKRDRPGGRDWGDRISSIDVQRIRRFDASIPRECNNVPMLFEDDSFRDSSVRLDRDYRDLHDLGIGDDASSVCVPRGWTVELFEDKNFRGERLIIYGENFIADLKRDRPDGRDWGDRISSARVYRDDRRRPGNRPGRFPDRPYDPGNRPDRNDPYDPNRNPNRTDPYDPNRYPDRNDPYGGNDPCSAYPIAYVDDGFRGRSIGLRSSIPDLHDLDFGDKITSICVPRGWRVVLYEDTNYRGDRLDVVGRELLTDLHRPHRNSRDWNDKASSLRVYAP